MNAEIKFLQLDYTVEPPKNSKEYKLGYLYIHKRLDTGHPFYVGISFDKNFRRAKNNEQRNNLWKKIVKKCGYKIEILFQKLPSDILLKKEIEFIKLYGRIDLGTGCLANLTDGGEGGNNCIRSIEHRDKLRLLNRKSPIAQYDLNNNLIYIWLDSKQPENFNYISNNITRCCKYGGIHGNSIWKYFNESLENITTLNKSLTKIYNTFNNFTKIVQIDYTDNIVNTYNSVSEIVALGFDATAVRNNLNGTYKICCGYKFEYYNENLHNIESVDRTKTYLPKKSAKSHKIVQCDINNTIINTYKSLNDAGKLSDIKKSRIISCLKNGKSYNNSYWQYYDINIHGYVIFDDIIEHSNNKKICQIGRDGYIINIFDNMNELLKLGYNVKWIKNSISEFKSLLNRQYIWKYYEETDDLSKCEYNYFKFIPMNKQPIVKFDVNNNFIQLYEGSRDIDKTKFATNCISKCCNGYIQNHNNHKFQFLKDYLKENPNFVPKTPNDINIYENFIFNEKHKITK